MPQDKVRVSSIRKSGSGAFECVWQRNDKAPGNTTDWKKVYTGKFLVTGINKGHFNKIKVIRGAQGNDELILDDDFEIIFTKV